MKIPVKLRVNGRETSVDVEPRTLLVQLLRDELSLTGTHVGCNTAQCGACTVHMDGRAVKSCSFLAAQAEGADVRTIEDVGNPDSLHPLQEAFRACHALQCGYCTPGMVMTGLQLLQDHPAPSERQIREGLEGNLCRCTGYDTIVQAMLRVAAMR